MKWVTRKSIRVNRTATAWLIRRFIDPDAVFLFVDADRVAETQRLEGARGFDAPGARYPHRDAEGRCSFEALVHEHQASDPVLREMGRIVHGADFAGDLALTPESAGLRTISQGFPLVARDDQEILERSGFLYDALYASIASHRRG
jgi:hypothetical protein